MTIYSSRLHLTVTILFVFAPVLFFLLFSRLAHIALSTLWLDILVSFSRLTLAYIISVIAAWLLAVLFYRGRRALIALPLFDVLQSFPTFAALPLAVFFWGPTNFTVTLFLILTVIWPLFFSILSSLKLIRRDWEDTVEIAGLRDPAYVRHFLIPVTTTGFITGSIIGLGEGWEALIATEIIVGMGIGLGNFFQSFSHNPAVTAFGVFGFLLLIFSINKLVWLPLLEWSHKKMEE